YEGDAGDDSGRRRRMGPGTDSREAMNQASSGIPGTRKNSLTGQWKWGNSGTLAMLSPHRNTIGSRSFDHIVTVFSSGSTIQTTAEPLSRNRFKRTVVPFGSSFGDRTSTARSGISSDHFGCISFFDSR